MYIVNFRRHRNYKFHLVINRLGYEDLLVELAKTGIKINLASTMPKCALSRDSCPAEFCDTEWEADIVVVPEPFFDLNMYVAPIVHIVIK